jgi:hypothetical protein
VDFTTHPILVQCDLRKVAFEEAQLNGIRIVPIVRTIKVVVISLAEIEVVMSKMERCPRCGSSAPHMHPAVQFEGEVEICVDTFHLTPTNQNRQCYIDAVLEKRKAKGLTP